MRHHTAPRLNAIPLLKVGLLLGLTLAAGLLACYLGIAEGTLPVIAVCTFAAVIVTTLCFWQHRIAVGFLGVSLLIGSGAISLQGLLMATELDIILFLIGIMVIVAGLKDLGFLTWLIQVILSRRRMSGRSFTVILTLLAALLSAVLGEISSIVIVLALVFQVCDTLRVKASPYVLIAVLSTNIGSAATMLGNPVGIFIGNKAGFHFNHFLMSATPITGVALLATLLVVLFWFRGDIATLSQRIEEHRQKQLALAPLFKLPHKRGIFVLALLLVIFMFHHQLEHILGLSGVENRNALLMITPLVIAALIMLYLPHRGQHYIAKGVSWWTLLFFMLLFAIAGGLKEQGVAQNLAQRLAGAIDGGANGAMIPTVLLCSAIGSAFMDNIVFVAAFTPIVKSLVECSSHYGILWWALLFGACFGGNVTIVGSTANIIALGELEKHGRQHISFFAWLKIGLVVTIITTLIAWAGLVWFPPPRMACSPHCDALETTR